MSNYFRGRARILPVTPYRRRRAKLRLIITTNVLFWGGFAALYLLQQVAK